MGIPVAPCKGCNKRQPACHDNCDEYAEWRKNRFKILDSLSEHRRFDRLVWGSEEDRVKPSTKHFYKY